MGVIVMVAMVVIVTVVVGVVLVMMSQSQNNLRIDTTPFHRKGGSADTTTLLELVGHANKMDALRSVGLWTPSGQFRRDTSCGATPSQM